MNVAQITWDTLRYELQLLALRYLFFKTEYNPCDHICILKTTDNVPVHFSYSLTLAVSHFLLHVATRNNNLLSNKPLSIYLSWWGAGNHMHMPKVLWAVPHEQDIAAIKKKKHWRWLELALTLAAISPSCYPANMFSCLERSWEKLRVRWTYKTLKQFLMDLWNVPLDVWRSKIR